MAALRLIGLALVLNLALWVFVAVRYPALAAQVSLPIHFNGDRQADRLADPIWAFYFPLMGTFLLAVNAGLALALRRRDALVPWLLLGSTLFLEAAVCLTALGIVT